MNIINWFISPKEHILKGDVVLSSAEFQARIEQHSHSNKKKQKMDISGLVYEYKDLGKLFKSYPLGNNYIVKTKRGEEYILDWKFMDRYFAENHMKLTQDYLKELRNGVSEKSESLVPKKKQNLVKKE